VGLLLVVNADDLGYDPEIDRGIFEAHARGVVTAASAMVDTPFSERALSEAPATIDLGLHVVVPDGASPGQVAEEIARQLGRFRALRGAPPTHHDRPRHAHAGAAAVEAFAWAARDEGIPLRALDEPMRAFLRRLGVATADHFLGDASLRPCWTEERLLSALRSLASVACGSVELMCHPGYRPALVRTSFALEREEELRALTLPAAREAIEASGATLGRFSEFAPRSA
jgi:predicted glycoside hydrolase/deacetylase ChbG (UPF0249 family)